MFFRNDDKQNQQPVQPAHDEDELTDAEELEGVTGGNMPTGVEKPTDDLLPAVQKLSHGSGGGGGAGIIAV